MPRERQEVDKAMLLRNAGKIYSALLTVEELSWSVDTDAAGELLESVAALARAMDKLRGTVD